MTPKHPSKPPNFTCRTAGPERLTVAQPPCPQTTAHPPTISRHDMYPNKPTTPAHTPHNQHTYKQTSTDTHTHTPTAHRSSTHACTHTRRPMLQCPMCGCLSPLTPLRLHATIFTRTSTTQPNHKTVLPDFNCPVRPLCPSRLAKPIKLWTETEDMNQHRWLANPLRSNPH